MAKVKSSLYVVAERALVRDFPAFEVSLPAAALPLAVVRSPEAE
jgi:hypothetical protein